MLSASDIAFFFFQAEDGIRDGHVTGVQTCALPIFTARTGATTMPHGPGTTPVDHAFRKDDRHDPEARTRTRPWRLDPGRWFRARSRAGASYPVDGAHSLRSGGAVRLRAAGGHVLLRGGDLGGSSPPA